jgi:hypothetical protein
VTALWILRLLRLSDRAAQALSHKRSMICSCLKRLTTVHCQLDRLCLSVRLIVFDETLADDIQLSRLAKAIHLSPLVYSAPNLVFT